MHDTVYLYSILNGYMVGLSVKPRLGTMQAMYALRRQLADDLEKKLRLIQDLG